MGDNPSQKLEEGAWKQFWTGRAAGQEHEFRDPAMAAVLHGHWDRVLGEAYADKSRISLIDLACGEGEVLRLAARAVDRHPNLVVDAVASDIAPDAVRLAVSHPAAFIPLPVVANGASLPFPDARFDLVVSQYGLEYAGASAFGEAGRIVAPGGRFHALVHYAGGAVAQSCQPVADLLEAVIAAGLLERLSEFAITIPRAASGSVSREEGMACAESLRQAVERVAKLAGPAATGPARDHVIRLVQDCQAVAGRLGAYRPEDLQAWITAQAAELDAFHHRMTSMLRVALGEDGMAAVLELLRQSGLTVDGVETLSMEEGAPPLAWVVDARREA